MDAVAAPGGVALDPGYISLSALSPGATGVIVGVGSHERELTSLDRRLLELGFCTGEQIEIIAETRPGRDPFVVRVGNTTLALRRCEVQTIWVDIKAHVAGSRPPTPAFNAAEGVDIKAHVAGSRPPTHAFNAAEGVDIKAHARVEISRPGKTL